MIHAILFFCHFFTLILIFGRFDMRPMVAHGEHTEKKKEKETSVLPLYTYLHHVHAIELESRHSRSCHTWETGLPRDVSMHRWKYRLNCQGTFQPFIRLIRTTRSSVAVCRASLCCFGKRCGPRGCGLLRVVVNRLVIQHRQRGGFTVAPWGRRPR